MTVTLLGNGGNCPLEGETVTTRINKSGKKRISILPKNGTTDENGKTEFTIIAKRLGRAKITFKTSLLKKSIIVIVKSKSNDKVNGKPFHKSFCLNYRPS